MGRLERKIPPPLITLILGCAMWGMAQITPHLDVSKNIRLILFIAFALVGIIFAMMGKQQFKKAATTVNPRNPEKASTLVTSGIYCYTRNPMYLGLVAVLLGWAIYLAALLALLGPVIALLYLTRYQIIPEERILQQKFGGLYAAYKNSTRRWV